MSSEEEESLALAGVAVAICLKNVKSASGSKRGRKWSREWLLKRNSYTHTNLLKELRAAPKDWKNYLRMDEETYLSLLCLVKPFIQKQDTAIRCAITAHERLSATLRFLATGRCYEDLKFTTMISPQALRVLIPETCRVIYKVLRKQYLKVSIY